METCCQPTQLVIARFAEMVGERSSGDPFEEHTPTDSGNPGCFGVNISSSVVGWDESADIKVGVGAQRIQPRQFVGNVVVGVVLMQVDPQGIGTVGSVDPEDHVGESANQSDASRLYREIL